MQVDERDLLIHEYKDQIADLESRNRQLNDKVNEIIYSKAANYKVKTLEKLK